MERANNKKPYALIRESIMKKPLKIIAGICLGIAWHIPTSILLGLLIQSLPAGTLGRAALQIFPGICLLFFVAAGIAFIMNFSRQRTEEPPPTAKAQRVVTIMAAIFIGLAAAIPAFFISGIGMAGYFYILGGSQWPGWGIFLLRVVPVAVFFSIAIPVALVVRRKFQQYRSDRSHPGTLRTRTIIVIGIMMLSGLLLVFIIHNKNKFLSSLFSMTTPAGSVPVKTADLPTAKTIAVGERFACALIAGGRVSCWGDTSFRQAGSGGFGPAARRSPEIEGILNAVALRAGGRDACALLSSGSLQCWGSGLVSNSILSDQLSGLVSFTLGRHICGLLSDGAVKCIGGDIDWQNPRKVSVGIPDLGEVAELSQGELHDCALLKSGTVKCRGSNMSGSLGDGTTTDRELPVVTKGVSDAIAVVSGSYHNCAILRNGQIKCWGDNTCGQLGDGTKISRLTPVAVAGLENATAITAGAYHTCALIAGSQVKCWGSNWEGAIGDGNPGAERLTPALVSKIKNVTAIDASKFNTCALLAGGEIWCWGYRIP